MTTITDTSLRIERTYDAAPEQVFDALTKPEILERWFAPPGMEVPEVQMDLREGGSYKVVMAGEERHTASGTIRKVTPPNLLSYTWSWEGNEAESLVTWELSEVSGGTKLVLTHERLPDTESTKRHEQGWLGCLERLPEVL